MLLNLCVIKIRFEQNELKIKLIIIKFNKLIKSFMYEIFSLYLAYFMKYKYVSIIIIIN